MSRALANKLGPGLLAGLLGLSPACGGTPCRELPNPVPMTAARAQQLDPSVSTGLAVSTTYVYGDCRPVPPPDPMAPPVCPADAMAACSRLRRALRVQVIPANTSIPRSEACDRSFAVSEVAPLSVADRSASAEGELVLAVPAGVYTVLLSFDGVCADCGILGAGGPCQVEVSDGQILARDMVLDRSTH